MTNNKSDIAPMIRRKVVPLKDLEEADKLAESAINSAALTLTGSEEPKSAMVEVDVTDPFHKAPKLKASEILNQSRFVDKAYARDGNSSTHFALYLNKFEKAAVCLIMESYGFNSMCDVVRKYGVEKMVEMAIEKLGFTEEDCQKFYEDGKDKELTAKRRRK